MAKKSPWDKIKAAFVAGEPVHAIAKNFSVPIAEILKRAKAEKWKRAGEEKPEPPRASVTTLPVAYTPQPEPIQAALKEAAADIVREHRERTRTQRDTYDRLQSEFQAMMSHLVSFTDADTVAKIKEGNVADRVKLLVDLLKATGIKFGMFERLTLMLREIITLEREVWGLNDAANADNTPQWDELLDLVRAPSTMRPLPAEVVDFERRLAEREGRE